MSNVYGGPGYTEETCKICDTEWTRYRGGSWDWKYLDCPKCQAEALASILKTLPQDASVSSKTKLELEKEVKSERLKGFMEAVEMLREHDKPQPSDDQDGFMAIRGSDFRMCADWLEEQKRKDKT